MFHFNLRSCLMIIYGLIMLLNLWCANTLTVTTAANINIPFGSILLSQFPYAPATLSLAMEVFNNASLIPIDPQLGIAPKLSIIRLDFTTFPSYPTSGPYAHSPVPGVQYFSYTSAVPSVAANFLTQKPMPFMVAGPIFSATQVTSVLEESHITIVAPTNVASVDRATYPYLVTTDCLVGTQGPVLAKLASELGWHKVAVLYNTQYEVLANSFISTSQSIGTQILTVQSFVSAATNLTREQDLSSQMLALQNSGALIFVLLLFQADIQPVFKQLDAAGLTGANYGCLGNNEWIRYLLSSPNLVGAVYPFLQGCIGTAIGVESTSPENINFLAEYHSKCVRDPQNMFGCPPPPTTSVLFYNTVIAIGYAYKVLYQTVTICGGSFIYDYDSPTDTYTFVNVNTTIWDHTNSRCTPYVSMDAGQMLNKMLNTPGATFPSLLGPVTIAADGSRVAQYSLVNFPRTDGIPLVFGTANGSASSDLSYSLSQVIWPGSMLSIPVDSPQILYDGLILSIVLNPGSALLAYLLAVVGCFVATILLEDPLLHAKQKKYNKGDYIQTLGSSLAFSIAAVWPTFCVACQQLSIEAISPLTFDPTKMMTVWLIVWFLFFSAINIKMLSFRSPSTESYVIQIVGRNSAAAHNRGRISAVGEEVSLPNLCEADMDLENDGDRVNRDAATVKQLQEGLTVFELARTLVSTLKFVDLYTLAAIVCLVGAMVVMEGMSIDSMIVPARITFHVATLVIGIIVVTALFLVALQLQFYLDVIQWITCLFTALPIFLSHQLSLMSLIFTYSTSAASSFDSSSGWSINLLVLISIVIAASCCFILIVVQFYRNKITSQGWLRQLVSLMRTNRKLNLQLSQYKSQCSELQESLDDAHVVMHLVNLSRPASFDHLSAFAWSLSQRSAANAMMAVPTKKRHSIKSSVNGSSIGSAEGLNLVGRVFSAVGNSDHNENTRPPTPTAGGAPGTLLCRSFSNTAPEREEFARSLEWIRSSTSKQALLTELINGPDLASVIQHPLGVEIFRSFLRENHSEESLHFIMHVHIYQAESRGSIKAELGSDIYALFIAKNSPQEVNLPSEIQRKITVDVLNNHFHSNLFDEAEKEIMNLMTVNTWRTFTNSPAYRLVNVLMSSKKTNLVTKRY